MRRLLAVLLIVGMSAGVAFGAGQQSSGAATAGEKIKLLWYVWDDPATKGHNEIAAGFMEENPNYEIEISRTPFGKYEETIRTILAGGDVPNVIQVNDDHVKYYAHSGWLNQLDDYAKDWTIQRDDTYTNFWDFNFYEGKMISVTPGVKVRVTFYNKTLLDQAGLAEPAAKWEDPNWNWDSALQYAKKLTKREGGRTAVWGYAVSHNAAAAAVWCDNNRAGPNDMYSVDGLNFLAATEPGWEAIQWITDLSTVHKVQPPWGISQKGANVVNLFVSGQLGITYGGSYDVPTFQDVDFEWDVASNPMKVEGHTGASLVCYGVPAKTKNPLESGRFAAYLMEEPTAKIWSLNGFAIPVVKEYAEKYYIQPDRKPSRQSVITNGLEVAWPPRFTVYTSKTKAIWDSSYRLTFSGEKTAKENMLAVKDEIETLLAGK